MAVREIELPSMLEGLPEQIQRVLVDAIPEIVWSARADGADDFFNRRLCEYTGLRPEGLAGEGWQEIIHPDEREGCRSRWLQSLASGEPFEFEYRLRRHDGVYRWHLGRGVALREGGRIVRWFGTCTDIEEQKQAERMLGDARRQLASEVGARTEALRASESRLRAIIDNEPECVKLLDAGGLLLEMNSAGLRMIEADGLEQVLGHSVLGIVAPEYRDAFRSLTERVCGGERGTLEFEIVGLKGTRRWLHTHATPFRDATRSDILLLGITRDVTEQKRAEQALAESEARFRSLAGLSSDWYWEQDENLRFVTRSRQMEELMGLGSESDIGMTRWELPVQGVSPEQWQEHRRTLESRLAFRDFEYQRLNERGERMWFSISGEPIFDDGGRFRGYRGVGSNITERKRAERALTESEVRFRSFMNSVPVLAWIKDSHFRYTWINEACRQRRKDLGVPVDGVTDTEVWGEERAREFHTGEQQALRKNGPVQSTIEVPENGGGMTHWLTVKFPLPDSTGALGIGGIAIDITERVELERAFRENEARIREATEIVRELMSRLVHAQEAERRKLAVDLHDLIGQKLTALGINLDIVRQRMPQAGATALAPRLHQMSTLLEETIGAIREVMSDLRPQVLDEHGLSAALVQYAADFEARTGLRVQVKRADKRVPLPHDVAIALFRIAQEALTNAAKHSGASRVVVSVAKSRERVELRVEDDGRGGLDRRKLHRGAGNGNGDGGWGLPMMRERAEAVGGRLKVEHADPGTRIVVEVPLGHGDQRHPG